MTLLRKFSRPNTSLLSSVLATLFLNIMYQTEIVVGVGVRVSSVDSVDGV